MDNHDQAVASIAANVRGFYDRKQPFRIYHGSTNSTRQSQYQRDKMIDTSFLKNILKIDTDAKTAIVQPNVPMDALVEATLRHGLIPPVVMEFPGITVGGGFAGTAGESSSFRHGFFDRTINWVEMVIPNGEIVKASSTENPDLFYGAASSFGTLGVTTLLEIRLIKSTKFVELTYIPVTSMSQALEEIIKATADSSVDYLDGIMFSLNNGVICSGRLTDDPRDPSYQNNVQGFTRSTDPWFYIHVQRLMAGQTTPKKEAIPITDYLFRYDRGGFWVARYAYKYFITPFNRITRYILDFYMHTRVMYHALHESGLSNSYIIQDVAIPYSQTTEFMAYLDTNFKHYPIWLCPLLLLQHQHHRGPDSTAYSLANHGSKSCSSDDDADERMMLNFGVWGPGPRARDLFVRWNRAFEREVRRLGGRKWLYAHTYYTEQEFDEIYDRDEYDVLRTKYHAGYLPSVYEKVKVQEEEEKEEEEEEEEVRLWARARAVFWDIWPLAGLYGVWKAFRGGDYLLSRKKNEEGGREA